MSHLQTFFPTPLQCASLLAGFVIITSTLSGASTPPAPPNPRDAEAIRLNDFEVSARQYDDYLPAELTSGTRYASHNLEIPFPVNVVTSEFIKDFLAADFFEALNYTSGFTQLTAEGPGIFVLRGIRNTSNFKNGVLGGYAFGPASVDRIEVVKGTNASIYGQTEPTGLINTVTKQARLDRAAYSFSAGLGTRSYENVQIDASLPLIPGKLAVRVAGSYDYTEQKARDHWYRRRSNVYGTATYALSKDTQATFNLDYIKTEPETGNNHPFVRNAANQVVGLLGQGEFERFYGFNTAGFATVNQLEARVADFTVNHRFDDVFSLRTVLSYSREDRQQFRVQGGANISMVNWLVTNDRRAYIALGGKHRRAAQVDLLSQFATGAIRHKLLFTVDYLREVQRSQQLLRQALLPQLSLDRPVYYNFPQTYFTFDRSVFGSPAADIISDITQAGLFLSERAALFGEKLLLLGGVRYDEIKTINVDHLAPAGSQRGVTKPRETTFQSGVLFRLTPAISFYSSFSQSFTPQENEAHIGIDGLPLDNFHGEGFDAGIKASLFTNRLNLTLGIYHVRKDNIGRRATDDLGNELFTPTRVAYFLPGEQESRGIEFDYNWRLNSALLLFGSYALVDAKWAYVPDQRHLPRERQIVGLPPFSSPKHNISAGGKLSLAALGVPGVSLRTGIRYRSEGLVSPTVRDVNGSLFYNPRSTLVDVGATFSWGERKNRFRHRLDANVRNLFDEKELVGQHAIDARTIVGTYTISF